MILRKTQNPPKKRGLFAGLGYLKNQVFSNPALKK